ncbi:MAG: catecholate siderophore receptor Fiu [Vitreoscilla sp.]|nr:catecholate siderophore receptor Fiu [Vitreoscilla sp.]
MSPYIRSRRFAPVAAAALSLPLALHAQNAPEPADAKAKALPAVTVKAAAEGAPAIKTDKLDSPKFTQPLVDTPQTITVVNKETLQQQGAATLMDALRNTPGITMQLGEGGRTDVGDSFFMRGFAAGSNVFQDGARDLGAAVRDVFNLEQVEIVKGPAGADNGRGATGGYVNLVSKRPQADDFTAASLSVGSASAVRAMVDFNRQLGDGVAIRLNAMASEADVPGRDELHKRSQGIAPSITLGLGTPTRLTVQSQHVRQRGTPDGGVTTIGLDGYYDSDFDTGAAAGVTPAKADPANYYGSVHDFEHTDADMVTVRVEHDFSRNLKLVNTARYGRATVDRMLTAVNGVIATSADPASWTVERRRHANLQSNDILANQTALQAEWATGAIRHSLAGGIEFGHERQNVTGLAVPGGNTAVLPSPVYMPDPSASLGPDPVANATYQHGRVTTAAAYLFNTIKLSPQWQLLAGLRHERYRAETERADLDDDDMLVSHALGRAGSLTSWKLGAVYKPATNGSIYLAFANGQTPPGGNGLTLTTESVSSNSADRAGLDPQRSQNVELGTKWELFGGQLALTAAAYRSTNRNEVIEVADGVYTQDGERRVQGLELGAVGQVTPDWQLSAGLATMDSEVVAGSYEGTNATGAPSRWTPKWAATFWTSYRVSGQLSLGGGARYLSRQSRVTDPAADLSTQNMPSIPAYWVADAMASYAVHKNVTLQLNVQNLFDKAYIATLNNNGNRYQPGAPRTVTLAANLLF